MKKKRPAGRAAAGSRAIKPAGGSPAVRVGRGGFVERHDCWTDRHRDTAKRVRALVAERNLKQVRVLFGDQHGIARGKTLTAGDFLETFENGCALTTALLSMDTANLITLPLFSADGGFGVEGMGGARDMIVVPDPETFRVLPWASDTGWVLGDLFLVDGRRCPFDTRHLYRLALERLAQKGMEFVAGLEVEFYIMRILDPRLSAEDSGQPPTPPEVELLSHGFQYQADARLDDAAPLFDRLRDNLLALGLPLRTMEDEWGPGQCEFTFDVGVGMAPADAMILFRSAVKQICRRQGYLATFMCKPAMPNLYSSGWHLHQSLRSTKTKKNLFVASDRKNLLSDLGRHYVGGLLEHAASCCAFANPTINGYKRLNVNALAPKLAVWSGDNKGAMLRVVGGQGDPITHLENRSGEPAANPYLYMASQILAGLDGIENRIDPGKPAVDPSAVTDGTRLPRSLMDAVAALRESKLFRAAFGDVFVDYFLHLKEHEIGRFLSHVTDWEQREYFEFY